MGVKNGIVLSLDNAAATGDRQSSSSSSCCSLRLHKDLAVQGFISVHGVANFLNVPYASIPARFRTARRLDPATLKGELDGCQYGPRCPQPHDPIHIVMAHMFEKLGTTQYTEELSCLTLNIYVPPEGLPGGGGAAGAQRGKDEGRAGQLPVFAWIHGGAFRCGDNTTEFDGNHLVARSIRLGQPIVVVTVNYRLNLLGFLTSAELEAEARDAGETPVRNQGLNDQRLALQWIQKYIGLFGGDAGNVTLGGESAGGASVQYQLHGQNGVGEGQEKALFCRALICSAPEPMLRSAAEGQALFDRLVASTGTSVTAPYQVKLAVLRSYSADALLALVPDLPVCYPFIDPDWFKSGNKSESELTSLSYWSRLPAWCPEVMVGCVRDETALFLARKHTIGMTTAEAQALLTDRVCPGDPAWAVAIWDAASLRAAATPLGRIIAFSTDIIMKWPAHAFAVAATATSSPSPSASHNLYLYSVDIVDPFPGIDIDGSSPGPLHGFAWHSFGNPLFFYQPACQTDAELGQTADKMTAALIGLMHRTETDWEPFGVAGRAMSWNGNRSGMVDVGMDAYDPVAIRLQQLGNAAWIQAYTEFKADRSKVASFLE